jgi:hypothetical protein
MKRLAAALVLASLFMVGGGDNKTTKTIKTEPGKTPAQTVDKTPAKT